MFQMWTNGDGMGHLAMVDGNVGSSVNNMAAMTMMGPTAGAGLGTAGVGVGAAPDLVAEMQNLIDEMSKRFLELKEYIL